MAKIEVKNGKIVEALGEVFKKLLESKAVTAILVPQETDDKETVAQTLVQDVANLKSPDPIAPVFPVNSARIVSMMTVGGVGGATPVKEGEEKVEGNIAVVLRPCEIRALVELVKLQQAILDNVVIIGLDCWGAYPVDVYAEKAKESKDKSVTDEFIKLARSNSEIEGLRSACQMCLYPAPTVSDLTIDLMDTDLEKEITIRATSDKGKKILEAMELEDTTETEEHKKAVENELAKRKAKHDNKEDVDFMHYFSTTCINCHNCMRVCPVCYCHQCVMEGSIFKYESSKFIPWAGKKGILKMPPDTYLFHFTRMSHIASACVACGQCESACPNDIPLAKLYHYLSKEVQDSLGYEAGRNLEEELPLTTFKEDELGEVES